MRQVLVTGSTGFIGRHLMELLLARTDTTIRVLTRSTQSVGHQRPPERVSAWPGDLAQPQSLRGCCTDIAEVFHLAGYAHAEERGDGPAGIHWRVTVEGTQALVAEAARAGVSRFIFVSSIKAMGEETQGCVNEESVALPATPYGKAKRAAEELVLQAGRDHGMHACVLRLPLVYGLSPKGNLPRMIAAVAAKRFPPLGNVHNQRSLVHVVDVVRALLLVAERPEAAGKVYLVTDGQPRSTGELYRLICRAVGRRPPRWSVPRLALHMFAAMGDLIGHLRGRPFAFNHETLAKLVGTACYDSTRIQRELGFRPLYTLEQTLPEIVVSMGLGRAKP
jgi:nucleoside-diphosphate-sugar epimerase